MARTTGNRGLRRKLALVACLAGACIPLAAPASASVELPRAHPAVNVPADWPLDIRAATVVQQGRSFAISIRTSGSISAAAIAASGGRSLCVAIFPPRSGNAVRRICLGTAAGKPAIVREALSSGGIPTSSIPLPGARISRQAANHLGVTVSAPDMGLKLGRFRWQAQSSWVDTADCPDPGCADSSPALPASARYAVPVVSGCVAAGRTPLSRGPRGHRTVAISFDDGPSRHTRQILSLLRRNRSHATFFQVGNQMGGMSSVQREILAEGNTIGDHSWSHPVLAKGGHSAAVEVSRTKSRIHSQSGFTPCLFRAPYGAISRSLVGLVKAQRMLTVQWDVDPTDWSRPGTSTIISRVLRQTRPGSIILMHDGGGDRSQTVAAVKAILPALKRRGYQVVSVESLLGLKLTYG